MTARTLIACNLQGDELEERGRWMRLLGSSLVGVEAYCCGARSAPRAARQACDEIEAFVRVESVWPAASSDFGQKTANGATELSIDAPEDAGLGRSRFRLAGFDRRLG